MATRASPAGTPHSSQTLDILQNRERGWLFALYRHEEAHQRPAGLWPPRGTVPAPGLRHPPPRTPHPPSPLSTLISSLALVSEAVPPVPHVHARPRSRRLQRHRRLGRAATFGLRSLPLHYSDSEPCDLPATAAPDSHPHPNLGSSSTSAPHIRRLSSHQHQHHGSVLLIHILIQVYRFLCPWGLIRGIIGLPQSAKIASTGIPDDTRICPH